jgi:hypothetical protein
MLPDPVKTLSPVESTMRGAAIWGENLRGPFWIEPFFAHVRIAEWLCRFSKGGADDNDRTSA